MAASKSVAPIAALWAAFAGSHLVLSHEPIRDQLMERLGPGPFQGVYSLVALSTMAPMVYLYARRRGTGPLIHNWGQSALMRAVAGTIKVGGALAFTQATVARSPVGMGEEKSTQAVEPHGILRITRHPLFLGFAMWGVGNVLVRGALADLVFWGGFPLFWVVGSLHQDARKRKVLPHEFYDRTSLLPFQAILEGRNSLSAAMREMSLPAAGAGLGLAAALYAIPRVLRR